MLTIKASQQSIKKQNINIVNLYGLNPKYIDVEKVNLSKGAENSIFNQTKQPVDR